MNNLFLYKDNFIKFRDTKSILQYGDPQKIKDPKFSVIIPVYGHPDFFVYAFNSVLHQDADFAYEVIVVDDTPWDGGKSDVLKLIEACQPPNVCYYRNEVNFGQTGNWNRGIELARAELVTFCHDDDMLYPNCLSELWKLHLKYPGKLVIPSCRIVDETVCEPKEEYRTPAKKPQSIPYKKIDIFMGNPTNGVGCLFYRSHLLALGGYNDEYYPSHDNAMHIKYIFEYGAMSYNQILYNYRITSANISNSVYPRFISNGLFYADCMLSRLGLPNFIAKMLKHAYKTNITITMEKVWGKKQVFSVKPSLSDRIVNRCMWLRAIYIRLSLL